MKVVSLAVLALTTLGSGAFAQDRFITLASTTSTANSGLFSHLLPIFKADTGISVRVVAVGTGQALSLARGGDADVLMVHHRPSEEIFVADGFGVSRQDVMYNDFVLVGPKADPANTNDAGGIGDALARVANAQAIFASRGDDSGTHKKELDLWLSAEIDPDDKKGGWYRELGAGMGATLNIAAEMNAYTLTDRATWISYNNKRDLTILLEGDPTLHNPYGVILVNPARHRNVKAQDGQVFIDWLISTRGQAAIAQFRVDDHQLFFPIASAEDPRQ